MGRHPVATTDRVPRVRDPRAGGVSAAQGRHRPAYRESEVPVALSAVPHCQAEVIWTPQKSGGTMDHEYEPGDERHPMHTDPLCRICGQPKRNHR